METWSVHGNPGASLTSGLDKTQASTIAGGVTAAVNIYSNGVNSHEAKKDLNAMMSDMDRLINSPCYKKLNPTHREDPYCKGKPTVSSGPSTGDVDKKKNKTGNDPSAIGFEGVIENPVEGDVVTLNCAVDGNGAMTKNGGAESAQIVANYASEVK